MAPVPAVGEGALMLGGSLMSWMLKDGRSRPANAFSFISPSGVAIVSVCARSSERSPGIGAAPPRLGASDIPISRQRRL